MRKTLLLAVLLCLPFLMAAQPHNGKPKHRKNKALLPKRKPYAWEIGMQNGASNYLGEMGGKDLTRRDFVSDMKLSQTHYTGGINTRYRFNQYLSVKGEADYIRISGADRLSSNAARNARNLSFRNDMYEFSSQAQFNFYEVNDLGGGYMHRVNFTSFVGAGIGAVYHNPKTLYNGEWVALRPLTTEGELKPYTKITAVIPVSAGLYFTIDHNYRVGWDVSWRTTFSDYLDDVSTTYASNWELPNSTSIDLANRTDELPNVSQAFANNFTPGSKRGDATHNDSYLTTSIDMSYVFTGASAWKKHVTGHHGGPSKFGNGPIRIKRWKF